MKRTVAGFCIAALLLAGCGTSSKEQPSAPATATVTATPTDAAAARESKFVASARMDDALALMDRDTLLAGGRAACRGFDQGVDWYGVEQAIAGTGMATKPAARLIAAAVTYLCPEHKRDVPGGR